LLPPRDIGLGLGLVSGDLDKEAEVTRDCVSNIEPMVEAQMQMVVQAVILYTNYFDWPVGLLPYSDLTSKIFYFFLLISSFLSLCISYTKMLQQGQTPVISSVFSIRAVNIFIFLATKFFLIAYIHSQAINSLMLGTVITATESNPRYLELLNLYYEGICTPSEDPSMFCGDRPVITLYTATVTMPLFLLFVLYFGPLVYIITLNIKAARPFSYETILLLIFSLVTNLSFYGAVPTDPLYQPGGRERMRTKSLPYLPPPSTRRLSLKVPKFLLARLKAELYHDTETRSLENSVSPSGVIKVKQILVRSKTQEGSGSRRGTTGCLISMDSFSMGARNAAFEGENATVKPILACPKTKLDHNTDTGEGSGSRRGTACSMDGLISMNSFFKDAGNVSFEEENATVKQILARLKTKFDQDTETRSLGDAGIKLNQMLAGKGAFEGENATDSKMKATRRLSLPQLTPPLRPPRCSTAPPLLTVRRRKKLEVGEIFFWRKTQKSLSLSYLQYQTLRKPAVLLRPPPPPPSSVRQNLPCQKPCQKPRGHRP
jgi:hypothetical protein